MKLKRFFKRGLQKAIANDFKNLVEDKSMSMPSGFLCYRYWDDGSKLTKRYYFVVNFAGSTRNCFTFECAWQPDVETDIVNSNVWPKSLSDDDGCLRIIYLDSRFSPPPIKPSEYELKSYEYLVNYDYWWDFETIDAEAPDLAQLDCILQDAVEKLGKLVMPFFRDLAAFHAGQPMPSYLMTIEQKLKR